jgi:hypothetical protein
MYNNKIKRYAVDIYENKQNLNSINTIAYILQLRHIYFNEWDNKLYFAIKSKRDIN